MKEKPERTKVTITLKTKLLDTIDEVASRLDWSRSLTIQTALKIAFGENDTVTAVFLKPIFEEALKKHVNLEEKPATP